MKLTYEELKKQADEENTYQPVVNDKEKVAEILD